MIFPLLLRINVLNFILKLLQYKTHDFVLPTIKYILDLTKILLLASFVVIITITTISTDILFTVIQIFSLINHCYSNHLFIILLF